MLQSREKDRAIFIFRANIYILGLVIKLIKINEDDDVNDELLQEIGSSAAFLGQSEYTAHFGLKKEGIEILYSVRIKWLAESSTTKPYEEIYYNVPTRTTLNVHRRSLNKIVINDSGDEIGVPIDITNEFDYSEDSCHYYRVEDGKIIDFEL